MASQDLDDFQDALDTIPGPAQPASAPNTQAAPIAPAAAAAQQPAGAPTPQRLQFLAPMVPNNIRATGLTKRQLREQLTQLANTIAGGMNADMFTTITQRMLQYARTIQDGNRGPSLADINAEIRLLYAEYTDEYARQLQSGQFTTRPEAVEPDYGRLQSDIQTQVSAYNQYVIAQVVNKLPLRESAIPPAIRNQLPFDYITNLNAYNALVQMTQTQGAAAVPFNFPKERLLLAPPMVPKPQPIQNIPAGFTQLSQDAFFKRLEGVVRSNYSDMMGEYRVTPATPSRLFLDTRTGKYIVQQGDRRSIFADVIEARRFALLGAFQADKVQQFRQQSSVYNVLRGRLRAVATVSV